MSKPTKPTAKKKVEAPKADPADDVDVDLDDE
jgi:hypothetical protein